MKPETLATLQKLEQAAWFVAVGKQDAEEALVLSSWAEAIPSCSSNAWQNLLIEAANQYTSQVFQRSRDRFNQWHVVVREMKPITEPLVMQKIASVVAAHALPKSFEHTVQWDILHLAMECEYADVYPPGFYASQAYWYVQGHFPCGWNGTFPAGKLIIY